MGKKYDKREWVKQKEDENKKKRVNKGMKETKN